MKRLIPAVIILVFIISICVCAHIYIDHACEQTLNDVNQYYKSTITASQLKSSWQERKEQMSLFVNHEFLDKISIYIGQLTVQENKSNSPDHDIVYKNIESVLELIKADQKFALHSFY